MQSPLKVVDLELSQPIAALQDLTGYLGIWGLVRWQGVPIGVVQVPVVNGGCEANRLKQAILDQQGEAMLRQVLIQSAIAGELARPIASQLRRPSKARNHLQPKVTVVVCTRDRAAQLAACLTALCQLRYSNLELLVIDNAPSDQTTQTLVQQYPQVRYVQEPRPGLDWARNRAILAATGEILAYTDDDALVDPDWVNAIVQILNENPAVMAVTGLVMPLELETQAQVLFEQNGGFGKGFQRQWWYFPAGQGMRWFDLGTGNLGTGANMAFRKSVFDEIGGFDPALDVGTATHGAGDLEMFLRVLKAGHAFVYEPQALVRHQHRRDYAQLRSQLQHNGAVYAALSRSALAYPELTLKLIRLGLSWFWSSNLRPWLTSSTYPASFPRDLQVAKLQGCLQGLTSYFKARQQAAAVIQKFGDLPIATTHQPPAANLPSTPITVRSLELAQPLTPILDVTDCWKTRIFVLWQGAAIGCIEIANQGQVISVDRLSQELVQQLGWRLLSVAQSTDPAIHQATGPAKAAAMVALADFLAIDPVLQPASLPLSVPVSIVIGTYDRPDDLRNCLRHLFAQATSRSVEIIVVDNHPSSGVTGPIVAEFPSVKLVNETRQGVAYARNAGIAASRGEIIVTVDDDVSMPPQWLELLLAPFARADVMAVTGNVLPVELETHSQQLFEQYGNGGLGRGFTDFEANRAWFDRSWMHAVPTWELGGTANSAYRARIFADPAIGLMDEALGPGMPSGVGEDIYLFYKILKADGTICYEAKAFVWHRHRRDMAALKRQLYNYSKGFVAYHLTTLLRDRDWRVLMTLFVFLPLYHVKQVLTWLQGDRFYPLSLIAVEVRGNLAGAWSLWRSRQRVRQLGRSISYSSPCNVAEPQPIEERPEVISQPTNDLSEFIAAKSVHARSVHD